MIVLCLLWALNPSFLFVSSSQSHEHPSANLNGYIVLPSSSNTSQILQGSWISVDEESKSDPFSGSGIVHLRKNGHFTIPNYMLAPHGSSHIVRFNSAHFKIPPVRVDVSSKGGRLRCRYFDPLASPGDLSLLIKDCPPLVIRNPEQFSYFDKQQQYSLRDVIFNPMVLMMALPLIVLFILPKLTVDDEDISPESNEDQQITR